MDGLRRMEPTGKTLNISEVSDLWPVDYEILCVLWTQLFLYGTTMLSNILCMYVPLYIVKSDTRVFLS